MPAPVPVPARRLPRPAQPPNRSWKPAQKAAGIAPLRRVYNLRHTFTTLALHAGISTFGHLARDGREHAIKLLDTYRGAEALNVHPVDAAWTPNEPFAVNADNGKRG